MAMTATEQAIAAGRDALSRGAWDEARKHFEEALKQQPVAEAFDGLAWAAWWLSDPELLFSARERAYRLYRDRGELADAARMAIWIASDHTDFRGETAIGNGWRQRARRLLDGLDTVPEHGWLALHDGDQALLAADDPAAAIRHGREAIAIGRRLDVPDLETLGLAMEGIALVTEGRAAEGMDRLDEATATAIGGELRETYSIAWALCYLIYACERVRDYDRAAQWCQKMREFGETYQFRFAMGICRAHYGGVLVWRGNWEQAEAELSSAIEDMKLSRPPMAAEAVVRLAELRRRQGRAAEAAELFMELEWHPLASIGLAELALDRGDATAAAERALGLLRSVPADNKTQRVAALEILVRAAALSGDAANAGQTLQALQDVARGIDSPPLRAATLFAEATAAAANGELAAARAGFEDAALQFGRTGAAFEMGRARMELARVLARLGRVDAAQREAGVACDAFREIGAAGEVERATEFMRELASADASTTEGRRSKLTPREREILHLVAQGRADREIAAALTLSEHTVHRHIANILTKLDVPSRAAAVARATRQGLL